MHTVVEPNVAHKVTIWSPTVLRVKGDTDLRYLIQMIESLRVGSPYFLKAHSHKIPHIVVIGVKYFDLMISMIWVLA